MTLVNATRTWVAIITFLGRTATNTPTTPHTKGEEKMFCKIFKANTTLQSEIGIQTLS